MNRAGQSVALGVAFATLLSAGGVSGCSRSTGTEPLTASPESAQSQQPGAGALDSTGAPIEASRWINPKLSDGVNRLADNLDASLAIAVSDLAGGRAEQFGQDAKPYAYSTIKIPMVATLFRLGGGPDDDSNMAAALQHSDNGAARAVYDRIIQLTGGERQAVNAINETLRMGGDTETKVPIAADLANWRQRQAIGVVSTYGQTRWRPNEQATFVAQLLNGCVLRPGPTKRLATWMSQVEPGQSWGLGSLSNVSAFKGGWGQDQNGGDYYVRQVALVEPSSGGPYVMAVTVRLHDPSPLAGGSIDRESAAIQSVGKWVAANVGPAPERAACASSGAE